LLGDTLTDTLAPFWRSGSSPRRLCQRRRSADSSVRIILPRPFH